MSVTVIPGRYDTSASTAGAAGFATTATGGRVQTAIANAASKTGVDFDYLYHQAKVESGLNPTAKATTSSASGLYQFTSQTWLGMVKQHGAEHGMQWASDAITRGSNGRYYVSDETTRAQILAMRADPDASAAMAGEYASDNRDYLQSHLGRDAGSVDLYMAHFFGPAGASRFLAARDADGGQTAAAINPAAARANRWVFYNKDGSARSLDEVYARFEARFGKGGTSVTPAAAPTASSTRTMLASRATDTADEIARMQAVALGGTDDAAATGSAIDRAANAKALLSPSPQTARLAYLMLSSLGV